MAKAGPVRYASCDGLQVAYQVVGDGPVDVLYVPGLVNHIDAMWDMPEMARFTERAAGFCRFILMDKRGTGLSDHMPTGRGSTVEERMHDVLAVLDAVGSESAHLFATADGAPLGIVAAASHPDRVAGLVLYAPSARLLEDDGYAGNPASRLSVIEAWMPEAWGTERRSNLAVSMPSMADDPRWRAGYARMQRRSCTPRAATEYWLLNERIDVREVLPVVSVPTRVVHCAGDPLFPVAHGRYVAAHIPDAKFVELDGVDHFPWVENGEQLADELEEFVTGQRSGTASHRRLATVMFTDLAESTRHDVELGDRRWRALLEAHDAFARVQIERHRGTLVKSTGDGSLAVFDGPQAAIAAAAAMRNAAADVGLQLHAGIHVGEIEQRPDDIAGIAVHIAARLTGVAERDEILVTRTVRDLVTGSGLTFVDRGEHKLKGVDEPWRLYEVT